MSASIRACLPVVVLLTGAVPAAAAPPAAAGPHLIAADMPGWRVDRPRRYTGKQLYGYINGGAEQYHEYGFEQVAAQRLSRGGARLKVDIYRMASAPAAFGIYSISHGTCAAALDGVAWSCVTPRRVSFCRARHVVTIAAVSGGAPARTAARRAALLLKRKIAGKAFEIPPLFREGALKKYRAGVRYLRGPLAVAAAAPDWEPRIRGIARFGLYLARAGRGKAAVFAADVSFPSSRAAKMFLRNIAIERLHAGRWSRTKRGATWIAARRLGPSRFQLLESSAAQALKAFMDLEPQVPKQAPRPVKRM